MYRMDTVSIIFGNTFTESNSQCATENGCDWKTRQFPFGAILAYFQVSNEKGAPGWLVYLLCIFNPRSWCVFFCSKNSDPSIQWLI